MMMEYEEVWEKIGRKNRELTGEDWIAEGSERSEYGSLSDCGLAIGRRYRCNTRNPWLIPGDEFVLMGGRLYEEVEERVVSVRYVRKPTSEDVDTLPQLREGWELGEYAIKCFDGIWQIRAELWRSRVAGTFRVISGNGYKLMVLDLPGDEFSAVFGEAK